MREILQRVLGFWSSQEALSFHGRHSIRQIPKGSLTVRYLPWLSCMFASAPLPNRKTHSSTLLIWAARITAVAPSCQRESPRSSKRHAATAHLTRKRMSLHNSNTNTNPYLQTLQPTPSCMSRMALKSHRVSQQDKQPLTAAGNNHNYGQYQMFIQNTV